MNATGTLTLRTVMESYPHTAGIVDGSIRSPRLGFDFIEAKPITKAFAPMANEQAYDVGEMAIVTFLQALAAGKPVVLLPALILARFHHGSIWKASNGPIRRPSDLDGTRIGVRSYTQTTGVWVRGILHAEYGVDLDSIVNVTTEGGHIKEYVEPLNVVRVPADTSFKTSLLSGDIAAWIAGPLAPDPELAPVIDDVQRAETEWFDRVGAFPINHMLTMRASLLDEHPWVAEEIFGLLAANKAAYRATLPPGAPDALPFGVEALRPSLDLVIDYALAQKLIPRRYTVDELFDPRVRALA